MRKALLTLLQFLLLLFTYAVATFTLPFHRESVLVHTGTLTRFFIWDGVIAAFLLFLVFVLIEAAMKRLRSALPWSALALVSPSPPASPSSSDSSLVTFECNCLHIGYVNTRNCTFLNLLNRPTIC